MPLELITAIVFFILRALASGWQRSQDNAARDAELKRSNREIEAGAWREVTEKISSGWFGFTACVIGIVAVASIVMLPKVAPFIEKDIPVSMAYEEQRHGVEVPFFYRQNGDIMKFKELEGIVLTEWDRHLLAAVIGTFLAGGSERRRVK